MKKLPVVVRAALVQLNTNLTHKKQNILIKTQLKANGFTEIMISKMYRKPEGTYHKYIFCVMFENTFKYVKLG